jgi:hypothetical protein
MTIANEVAYGKAAGNDVATSWTIAVSIRVKDTVVVQYENTSGVLSALTLDVDYTVTGITDDGFTLTLTSFLLATGEYLHVRSEEDFTQELPLPAGSNYPADTIEAAFDKLTRLAQQLKLTLTQCIKLALPRVGDTTNLEIDEDLSAGSYLKVNDTGTGFQQVSGVLPDDVTVTPFAETLLAAVSAAAMRTVLDVPQLPSGGVYCNNANGNPNISDIPFQIFTAATPTLYVLEDTWTSIGPIDSGADKTWAALDDLPDDIHWIDIRINYMFYGNGGINDSDISMYVRRNGSTQAKDNDKNRVIYQYVNYITTQIRATGMPVVRVPVADKVFDLYWERNHFIYGISSAMLVGAGYNEITL